MPNDFELQHFTEEWWRSFMVYEAEEGRAYVRQLFEYVHKEHFVDFLRDAIAEFCSEED